MFIAYQAPVTAHFNLTPCFDLFMINSAIFFSRHSSNTKLYVVFELPLDEIN